MPSLRRSINDPFKELGCAVIRQALYEYSDYRRTKDYGKSAKQFFNSKELNNLINFFGLELNADFLRKGIKAGMHRLRHQL